MVEAQFQSFFDVIHGPAQGLRDLVGNIAPNFATAALLGLSLAGGWWLAKKFPATSQKVIFVLYGVIIFLIVRFI